MSNTPKVDKWHYPFASAHKNSLEHLAAMGKANSGYYPIGANGIWHGGVHFDGGTASAYEQSRVLCIADGEVVAYRIDTQYPTTHYFPARASFSTGFVLVRHRLEIPPAPGAAMGGPSLTFFSLYMHLRDWAGYEADSSLTRPAFWQAVTEYEVTTQDTPLRLRRLPNANGEEVATLPKGTLISVGTIEGDFREVLGVISGTPSAVLAPLSADTPRLGWVASRYLTPRGQPTPQSKDTVVVLPQPIPIQAGELIGYPGVYQQPTQAAPETMLHLELFSCEDVPAFMAQSKTYGARLPSREKSVMKVAKGERLIPHHESFTATTPPNRYADDALTIGVDLMLPQSYLDSLPSTHKITQRLTGDSAATEWVIHWWRLENLVPDAQGNPIDGWFAEQDLITIRHSPWEWEGYQCIKETGTAVEMHAYAFNARGLLSPEEKENFRAQINKADEGPIVAITRLHNMIDTDGNGVLSADEIRAALGKPWQAQILAQLVTHYESEWFWSDKWDELDELMQHTPAEPDKQWVASKTRIQKLSWWADVAGVAGIAVDGKAWHFQPMELLGYRVKANRCFCFEQGAVNAPCQQGLLEVTKQHFEDLATQLGVEREVLRAIAVAETGDKSPFKEYVPQQRHALVLYERHYMLRLLKKSGMSQAQAEQLVVNEPKIVHPYVSDYPYGTLAEQHVRLLRARQLHYDAANMSCSWGKFQVMGEYYRHLYSSTQELVAAQNYCALQHLQYFKIFLTHEKRMLEDMREKNWRTIAEKYNGRSQVGYDVKIRDAYNSLKREW